MNIQTLFEKLQEINKLLLPIIEESGFKEYADLLTTDWNETNPNDCMLYNSIFDLMNHLSYVNHVVSYLEKPISHEGILTYNKNEKYEVDGIELCEGDRLEVLGISDITNRYEWKIERFSYRNKTQTMFRSFVSDGKRVRIRGGKI